MPKYSTAPKRRIERIRSRINDIIANTANTEILHTAEDAKTLVRTIIDLKVVLSSAAVSTFVYNMIIQLQPAGVQILPPSVAQALDVPLPINVIWEESGVDNVETVVGEYNIQHIQIDLKSQRKMKEGDTITWAHIANAAAAYTVAGVIVLFFKE